MLKLSILIYMFIVRITFPTILWLVCCHLKSLVLQRLVPFVSHCHVPAVFVAIIKLWTLRNTCLFWAKQSSGLHHQKYYCLLLVDMEGRVFVD